MQDEKEYLAALFRKYQEGRVTEAEKEIIARWLIHLDVHEMPLTENELLQKEQRSKEALKESLFPQHIPGPKVIRMPRWIQVAAVILLLLTVGLYFYHKPKTTSSIASRVEKKDILPGTNRAILTLSNGSKINLTEVNNGILAQQGAASIHKTNDGEVVYTAAGKADTTDMMAAPLINTVSTPKGGQYQVVLPDGTKVWLNAASYIRFPAVFANDQRKVEIGGEVYFEVAKNRLKPFTVSSAGQQLTVLGTHFNINAYPEENTLKTTLLEGSVKVSSGAASVMLQPGQQSQLITRNGLPAIQVSADIDIEEVVAWKNGLFQFDKADIKTIMNQVARWYNVDVEFAGRPPADHYHGKVPRNASIGKVLKILELSGIHFSIEGRKIIVKP